MTPRGKRSRLIMISIFFNFITRGYFIDQDIPGWRRNQAIHQMTDYNDVSLRTLCQMSNGPRLMTHLNHILIPRPVGSENHKLVGLYIEQTLRSSGFTIEHDTFNQNTVNGVTTFENIIATLDPNAPRRLTLACHYDSKDLKDRKGFEFMGATDSAFPCALLLDVAQSLAPYMANRGARQVTLQLLFLDGEEAFADWTSRDSLYGSRHLAELWERVPFPPLSFDTREIHRIDLLILLDLLGAAGSTVPNYIAIDDQRGYGTFVDIETKLRRLPGCLDLSPPNSDVIFKGRETWLVVQDDQMPFVQKGVPVVHMVPMPFPKVWHTRSDDRNALNERTMTNWATIVRVFVARYLALRL